LGPTGDDITREAVVDATGQTLEQRPEIVERLQATFARWGRTLTENNLRQTFLPSGAEIIPNPIGTAPGFLIEAANGVIICMPGVPQEMKRMMSDWVLPYIQKHMGSDHMVISARILHTVGVGESVIDDHISDLMQSGNPTIGLSAHLGRCDIRLAARAATIADAQAMIEELEAKVRQRLSPWIYGVDDDTLASVVAGRLRQRGATLALLETNTVGRIAAGFIDSGQNDVLLEFHTAESLSSSAELLGIASEIGLDEASAKMAVALLRDQSETDYALVVMGSMRPDQGFWAVDRGKTWVALATPEQTFTKHFPIGGSDEFSSSWLSVNSLDFLRKHLMTSDS
jgi:nicotinamide-nucleotide amidase